MAIDNNYGVLIDFKFESFEEANSKFKKIINELQKVGKLDIKPNVKEEYIKDILKEFDRLKDVKVNVDTNGAYSKIETLADKTGQMIKLIQEYNNQGQLLSTKVGVGASSKQDEKLIEQIEKVKQKRDELNKAEEKSLQINQADASNKALEEQYKNVALYERAERQKTLKQQEEINKRIKLEQNYSDLWNKLLNDKSRSTRADALKQEEAQILKEIKVSEEYEQKLKEIQATKLKMTQAVNIGKSEGWLNNSTFTNIQKQIDKINVNTPKEKVQQLMSIVNNIGTSEGKVRVLQSSINDAKATISNIKENSKDFLNIDSNNQKFIELQNNLKNAESILNKLKKNSLSVNDTSYKDTLSKLGSSNSTVEGLAQENSQVKELIKNKIRLLEIEKSRLDRTYGNKIDTSSITEAINKLKTLDSINLSNLKTEFKNIDINIKELTESAKGNDSTFTKLSNTMSNFGIYINLADIIRKIGQEFKQATEYIETMDKSLTNIQMITGKSKSEVSDMISQYEDLGKEMSTTNLEMMAGAEETTRAGYDLDTSKKIIESAILGSKISGQTTKQVTEQLIAIKNAFDLTGNDMEKVVDNISKMDNTSATSFNEISSAIQRTAFSAQQAGTPLEKLISYITTVSEKTKKPAETIGESFKTIYARYSNIKLGNLDDEGKSINDTEKAMKRIGIEIRKDKDTFKDFDDVLSEFMNKFKNGELTQVDYLAGVQALAGTRQRETLMALIENTESLEKHQNDLNDSVGTSRKMVEEVYSDSLDARIQNLKRSMEGLYNNILNSDALKVGIKGLTSFVETFGNLPSVIGLATTALLLFKGKAILGYISTLGSLAVTEGVVATATTELSFAFNKLKLTIMDNPLGVLAVALTGIVVLLSNVETQTEKFEKTLANLKSAQDTLSETNDNSKLVSDYEKLQSKIESNTLSTDEMTNSKKELLELQKQLANTFPDLITGFDKEGNAIATNLDKINGRIKETREGAIRDSESSYKTMQKMIKSAYTGDHQFLGIKLQRIPYEDDTQKDIYDKINKSDDSKVFTMTEEYKYFLELQKKSIVLTQTQQDEYKGIRTILEEFNNYVSDLYKNKADVSKYNIFDFDKGEMVNAKEYFDDMSESTKELGKNFKDASNNVKDLATQIDELTKSFDDLSSQIDIIQKAIDELETYGGLTDSTYSSLLKNSPEAVKALMKQGDAIENLKALQKGLRDEQEKTKEEAIHKILSGTEDTSNVDNSKIEEQSKAYEEANKKRQEAINETGKQELNNILTSKSNWDSYIKDKTSSDIGFNNTVRTNSANTTNELSGNYQLDANNFENAEQAKRNALADTAKAQIEILATSNSQWDKYSASKKLADMGNVDMKNFNNGYKDQLIEAGYKYDGSQWILETKKKETIDTSEVDKIVSQYKSVSPSIISDEQKSAISEANKLSEKQASTDYRVDNVEDLTNAYYNLENAISLVDSKMKLLEEKQKYIYGNDKISSMKQNINLLKDEVNLHRQMVSEIKNQMSIKQSELRSSQPSIAFNADGIISNYNAILSSLRNQANAIADNSEQGKNAKTEAINNLKELKTKMDEYNSTVLKNLQDEMTAIESTSNTIKDQYKEIVQLTATAEDKISDIIQKEIEKRYDKRKEALEKQKQLYEDSYKDEDYEDSKAELEDKIQTISQDLMSAMKSQDQSAIKDLQQQKADAMKELNDLVTDKERENASGVFDKALEDIDTQKDDMLKTENLTKMVTEAMQSGFINVNGEIINLSDSMNTFLKESVVGTANLKLQMDELATSISNGVAGLKDLGSYSGFLNSSNLVNNTLSENGLSGANGAYYTKNNSSNVTYKAGDVYIKGSVTEEVFPKLKAEMQNIADGAVNKFVKYVNGQ